MVIDDLFHEHLTKTLEDAAMNLAFKELWIDDTANVIDDAVAHD